MHYCYVPFLLFLIKILIYHFFFVFTEKYTLKTLSMFSEDLIPFLICTQPLITQIASITFYEYSIEKISK